MSTPSGAAPGNNFDAAEFDRQIARTFRASRYAERLCTADPSLLPWLASRTQRHLSGELADLGPDGPAATTPALAVEDTSPDAALRAARRRFMLALIFRDVNGVADFDEVVTAISRFADQTVNAAVAHHQAALARDYGLPAAPPRASTPLVVGMGKLGGNELNASSDIDLIFVHEEDGAANAERSWHQFHAELGKRLIKSIDEVTAQGFVFRVDMRLRPYGISGPLVCSLDALDDYFRRAARPWERYAWLKARALTGSQAGRERLDRLVQPFVYRRYHDYAAIDEMRSLHAQIRAEATKRRRDDDIKVGVGGIREVEFVAQLPQLIRGGREMRLQTRSTREALNEIAAQGLMPRATVERLRAAYLFLRSLEHRLQYLDDQQTQSLPSADADRERIADAMGLPDWPSLMSALAAHREVVADAFDGAFRGETTGQSATSPAASGTETSSTNSPIHGVFQDFSPETAHESATFTSTQKAIEDRISTWQTSARAQSLSPKLRERIVALLPAAVRAALAYDTSPNTFFAVLELIEAVDKRETYLALLAEYPGVLNRVAHLGAKSAWASAFLRRHPVLLDEFVSPRSAAEGIDWNSQRAALQARCDHAAGDVEQLYEHLRHTKQVLTLQLNLADLEGRLSVMALSDELSALADLLIDTTLTLVARHLGLAPPTGWATVPGVAVLGYGKLGSKELGYSSDLDLVFVFDPTRISTSTDQIARFVQRVNNWLNTVTAGGLLYETDLRLRPDGAAGMMASPLDAFADYQRQRAWTWEHQALTRARWCAGDPALRAPFEAIRTEILQRPRDRSALAQEVVAMREKMRAQKKDRSDALNLKHTVGGMVDIEFIVQFLILAYSHEHHEFLGNLGNFALLTRAGALGLIDEEDAAGIAKAYLAYRERQHRARTNNEMSTWIGSDELSDERRVVQRTWRSLLPTLVT